MDSKDCDRKCKEHVKEEGIGEVTNVEAWRGDCGSRERRGFQEAHSTTPRTARRLRKTRRAKDLTLNRRRWICHKGVTTHCGESLRNLCECVTFALKNYIILKKKIFFK